MASPVEGRKNFSGTIQAAEPPEVVLDVDGKAFRLRLAEIKKARLQVDLQPPARRADGSGPGGRTERKPKAAQPAEQGTK